MKKAFQILKKRPQIVFKVTRDSVCMADDCEAPHEKEIKSYSFTDPVELAQAISGGYLPTVAGVGHTWVCKLNGKGIAEIRVGESESLVREVPYEDENNVHFTYKSASY